MLIFRIINICLLSIFSVGVAQAQGSPPATAANMECQMAAVTQLLDGGAYKGQPVYIDPSGKSVLNQNYGDKLKRTLENGVETISYPVQASPWDPSKTVQHTVIIKRDDKGRVTSILRPMDEAAQAAEMKELKFKEPIIKNNETTFTYDGTGCSVNQRLGLLKQDDKEQTRVYFDKKFCEGLNKGLAELGSQNAAKCASFVDSATKAMTIRNKELATENKSFNAFSKNNEKGGGLIGTDVSGAIAACMANTGAGYMGMGYGGFAGNPYMNPYPQNSPLGWPVMPYPMNGNISKPEKTTN